MGVNMEYLKNKIGKDEFEILKNFKPRDGFQFVEKDDFERMFKFYQEYEIYKNLLPILTDNNSNYYCLYVGGPLKGTICYFSHDEVNLEPRFKNLTKFINAINKYPDAYDFDELQDLEIQIFDYPKRGNEIDLDNREEIITELLNEWKQIPEDDDLKEQLAFCVMALAKTDEIESYVYPFLDDEDMYIQERAIEIIAFHRYEPARNKLIELTKTGTVNGKSAAEFVLKKWKKQKIQ